MAPELRHLHLATRDPVRSQRFDETYFGFRFDGLFARGEQASATILRARSGFQLYLEAASSAALPGWFHFGFLAESAEACRALHDRMQREQVPISRPFTEVPFASFFAHEPDGHELQVYFDPRAAQPSGLAPAQR